MFRPDASLPLRFARTVLVPFGPLIVVIALRNFQALPEPVAGKLLLFAMAWFFCSLILVPALLFRTQPSPGDSTDGGGSGSGPQEPPSPDPGLAKLPLPDAEQSSERIRDHARRKRRWARRRTAREPEPTPPRSPTSS